MTFPHAPVLVVAATQPELVTADGWRTLVCGIGPIEAAVATAAAIASERPSAIVHVGIAGARAASTLEPPALVIGRRAIYHDLVVPPEWAPLEVAADPALLAAVQAAFPDAATVDIGTSGRVGGTVACDVEAMEGFGVLRAAAHAGVPAIEVRAISNLIEEPDRSRWRFDDAFAAINGALPRLVEAARSCAS